MLDPRAADIWRLDVTTVGGFTEAQRILGLASAYGVPLSPHIYAELHVHLAASAAAVISVEYVPPESEIDLSHRFIGAPLVPVAGRLGVPADPGLGIELDLERVRAAATESYVA
jgi:L-alanine-DL-glutamate epimerase-like enolase superfamily enzyme